MTLKVIAIDCQVAAFPELAHIEYDSGKLSVSAYVNRKQVARVVFESVEGFRVLDEGDLLEFWPMCSSRSGHWIWEIQEGGWIALESTRPGFVGKKYKQATEYLITGQNECVSVISFDRPTLVEQGL